MNASICFVAVNGADTMDHFDQLHPSVKRLFYQTEQNLCAYCAEETARLWAGDPRPPLEVWIEVIRQMERGQISEHNPFADLRAESDYRRREEYERKFAYQRISGRSENFNPRYDRARPTLDDYAFSRFQQADRDRDERQTAFERYVQDLERSRPRRLDADMLAQDRTRLEKVLHHPERTRRWPWAERQG